MAAPRKKLIEVALPLEAINAASAREKSIRHGHPSTLHLWWARRPLAACRAVLFAQLVDDPSSWPDRFPTEEAQGAERKRLHDFIAELVKWENSNDERTLNQARWYIARSLAWGRGEEPPAEGNPGAVRRYLLEHAPPVYDPFCGGGSIPLEAQRLGLRAFGSDLNPVAVMISKALVEFPPKFAGLPPVNPEARKKLANGGAWGAHVPLVSGFMLATKPRKEAWVEPVLDASVCDGYRFEVRTGKISGEEIEQKKSGTKAGGSANFRCALTGAIIKRAHIVAESKAGRMGARLMAIVAEGSRGRIYLSPNEKHERIAASAKPAWAPETELPKKALGFRVQEYGITKHRGLFTPRQLVALTTFSDLVLKARAKALDDAKAAGIDSDLTPLADGGAGVQAYTDAAAVCLAMGLGRCADFWCTMRRGRSSERDTLLPVVWVSNS